jgi:hypothetical protein
MALCSIVYSDKIIVMSTYLVKLGILMDDDTCENTNNKFSENTNNKKFSENTNNKKFCENTNNKKFSENTNNKKFSENTNNK